MPFLSGIFSYCEDDSSIQERLEWVPLGTGAAADVFGVFAAI